MTLTNSEGVRVIPGLEKWQLLPIGAIISTKQRQGLLPISKSTFLSLVKKGLAPAGKKIFGRTNFWTFGDIIDFSKKIGGNVDDI